MIIKDSIYRFIQVPELCRKFIDTMPFQRLRGIKQLGMCYYVFPGATHTRFEHSIGVMHLCGVLLNHLRDNCGMKIEPRTALLVQLGGLLHDQGHMCYSHLVDQLPNYGNHEARSIAIFHKQNEQLGCPLTRREVEMVENIILGKIPEDEKEQAFLYEIVSNKTNGVECDRMDYLQRDAYYCGMSGFQGDYLIACSYVNEAGRLALLPKAKTELKLMMDTRKRMFATVYQHPKVLKVQEMFIELMKRHEIMPLETEEDGDIIHRLKTAAKDDYESFVLRAWKTHYKN
jgi:HD superfamily phosphohydrolase